MKLKSLDHILVLADDLEATKDFYVDIIGLSVGDRPDFSFPGY
jgi:catechol 2,3-dioxygenase-like lactoylglutathione lyase family enzyme